MDQPTRQQQQRDPIPSSPTAAAAPHPQQQQTTRKPLAIHPPPPHTRPTTTYDAKPRRSSSISSQSSSIFSLSNNGLVSSSPSSFIPSSPLFRTGYNKLGGSSVGITAVVGSMPGAVGVGVGSPFSPYLGQQSPYGTNAGRRGFSSSTLSLLSSHPSSPGMLPASSAFSTPENRMPFDMEAIDMSESEGEQDFVASVDGDDESESSGSEEGDDVFSVSDRDDSDNDDQEDSGIEGDPIPAASSLSSSAPSSSMMTGRLRSPDQRRETTLVPDVHAARTTAPANKEEERLSTVSEQHSDEDNDATSLGSLQSSPLSHPTPAYSTQSTTPSSPSLSVSPYPSDSEFIRSRLPEVLSSSSPIPVSIIPDTLDDANHTPDLLPGKPESVALPLAPSQASVTNIDNYTTPLSPLQDRKHEQDDIFEETLSRGTPVAQELSEVARQNAQGLLDEGVFEDEEDHDRQTLSDIEKTQAAATQRTIEMETLPDGYGSLPKYSTHATTDIIPHPDDNVRDQSASSSSTYAAVVTELKEVRKAVQDLHKRMDRLELSLQSSGPQNDKSTPV
ncbi:hypothetical protein BG015_011223 [Linnemannia schmuckeri]|uniref:Uncharacterized protein n=1 Tax=Linnemannia schmuckeri TaxID=64567 RepID=A0A9P5RSW7_9FUNG|nr:hypothetical protein BG015_011223 [Linnemannia schmuckeri]